MNNRQSRVCFAAEASVTCARGLAPDQPRVIAAADRVEAAVAAARAASLKQLAAREARRSPANSIKHAKTALFHKHLLPIATDGLELLSGTEGIDEELRIPALAAHVGDHLRAAQRVREVAGQYEREFIESRDYAPGFLDRFDQAISDLIRAASDGQGAARANYSAATREVKAAVEEVQRCFDSLNARVKEACFADRAALSEWRRRSRIPKKAGRPRKRKGKEKPGDGGESGEASTGGRGAE